MLVRAHFSHDTYNLPVWIVAGLSFSLSKHQTIKTYGGVEV